MHVERPQNVVFVVHHEQAVDLERLHQLHDLDREAVGVRGLGAACHDLGDTGLVDIHAARQHAPQVAVSEYAHQRAVAVHHAGHAEALAGHFQQRLAQARVLADLGNGGAGVHDVAHVQQQAPAEAAGRMRTRKILAREAARLEQRHRQCVADSERGRGAGGRRQVVRAGFLLDAGV